MLVLPEQGEATRLVLVRHAETDEAARGRCYGRLDVPLSADGRRQAAALAAAFAEIPLAAVHSSPLRRALDTAFALAAPHGLEPVPREELAELDFGELEGLRYDEIGVRYPELYAAWMERPTTVRFPGGESFADLRARVLAVVAEIRARHVGEVSAVVAHGGVVRVILAAALGLPDGEVFRIEQAFGGVSVVDWVGETVAVPAVNVVLYSPA